MGGTPTSRACTSSECPTSGLAAPERAPLESGAPESHEALRSTHPSAHEAETLGAMTEIAVHEINNVLHWLRMTLDIAGQETKKYDLPQLQTKLVPAVADARLGVEHIADIVRELRDLRRPYANKPDAFDPTEALRA
ncbi:MAG: hypothetical protein ACYC6C_13885, partial [Coriobacteriia bacterium]